jgi:hypothetical protein
MARKIRVDDIDAWREARVRRGFEELHGEFVSHDARISEEGVLALENMIIRAAYADAEGPHHCLFRIDFRIRPLHKTQLAGFHANKGVHELNAPQATG